ncbi:hypothetical protein, partial [Chloroflexus sp.]|uniref:hypothetical protein n=1 Tax=Chloroflexus sp. TaxID=1904827 RepID=UPI002FD929B2
QLNPRNPSVLRAASLERFTASLPTRYDRAQPVFGPVSRSAILTYQHPPSTRAPLAQSEKTAAFLNAPASA